MRDWPILCSSKIDIIKRPPFFLALAAKSFLSKIPLTDYCPSAHAYVSNL